MILIVLLRVTADDKGTIYLLGWERNEILEVNEKRSGFERFTLVYCPAVTSRYRAFNTTERRTPLLLERSNTTI